MKVWFGKKNPVTNTETFTQFKEIYPTASKTELSGENTKCITDTVIQYSLE
jgi:hypothetical protein